MKRRDWRIKKLKKDIYDKKKTKKSFFLRRLFLKKNLSFLKKNLSMHFIFFKFFLRFFCYSKKFYVKHIYFLKNLHSFRNSFIVYPEFFFRKKVFSGFNNFNNFLKKIEFNWLFFYNSKSFGNIKGNNLILFGEENIENKLISLNLKSENEFDSYKNLLAIKYFNYDIFNNLYKIDYIFNFFFNYNFVLMQLIDIYKILIYLYLNNIIK